VEVKRISIDKSVKLKKLVSMLDTECINEVSVYDEGKKITTLCQDDLNETFLNGDLYAEIGEIIEKRVV
jgi:predicted transcriptional regulator